MPSEVRDLFLRTLFSNFVNTGHSVLFVPFVGVSYEQISEMLPNLSDETIKREVSILCYEGDANEKSSLTGEMSEDIGLINTAIQELGKKSNKPVLIVMAQDALEGLYGAYSISKDLTEWIATLKRSGNIWVQITSPYSKLLQELRAFCDADLRIEIVHGAPIMFSVKPLSEIHGIICEPEATGKLGLIPIV